MKSIIKWILILCVGFFAYKALLNKLNSFLEDGTEEVS